jgi:hypothetical protein
MKPGGKVKLGSAKNRGYIGYHNTWDNKKVFLRSKAEFIFAKSLDIERIPYMLECVTYRIDNKCYKPDFFIFDRNYNTIKKIIEIKGLDDKKTALTYLDKYKPYFNSIGIEYDVVWKYQSLITKYQLHDEIANWITTSIQKYDFISDTSGKNNPMYGRKQTEETKKRIQSKAIERQTDEYRKKNSEAQMAFWATARGLQRKQEISLQRTQDAILKNPIVDRQCKHCNNIFQTKLKTKKQFCSGACNRTWSYKNTPGYGKWRKKHG